MAKSKFLRNCLAHDSIPKGATPSVPLKIKDAHDDLDKQWNDILRECGKKLTMTIINYHENQIAKYTQLAEDQKPDCPPWIYYHGAKHPHNDWEFNSGVAKWNNSNIPSITLSINNIHIYTNLCNSFCGVYTMTCLDTNICYCSCPTMLCIHLTYIKGALLWSASKCLDTHTQLSTTCISIFVRNEFCDARNGVSIENMICIWIV